MTTITTPLKALHLLTKTNNSISKLPHIHTLFLVFYFSFSTLFSNAQCIVAPPPLTCPIAGSIELTEGASVNTGNTYTVSATSNLNNITMNGGDLVVCGSLNLSNITFNSGNLYVAPSGNLTVNNSTAVVLGNNSSIYNYGNILFQVSIVTGTNNIIYNCALNSVFNIPFNQMVIQGPNTYFINNGLFNSNFFIVQSTNSPNVICSGNGSAITTGIMINQFANAFNSPLGISCIQITNQIINSQPMTTSSNVQICYQAALVNVIQGPNFGNATVNNSCTSCSIALPLEIVELKASCFSNKIHVTWSVESEPSCAEYTIQRSTDGFIFEDAIVVECQGNSTSQLQYTAVLPVNYLAEQEYVKLKRTETNGGTLTSNTINVICPTVTTISIYPTMIVTPFITVNADQWIESITMYSMDGKVVQRFPVDGSQKEIVIEIDNLVAIGQYMLTVLTESTRVDKLLRIVR